MTVILADESVEYAIILRLRTEDFTVLAVTALAPAIPDDQVLEMAIQNGAIDLLAALILHH